MLSVNAWKTKVVTKYNEIKAFSEQLPTLYILPDSSVPNATSILKEVNRRNNLPINI